MQQHFPEGYVVDLEEEAVVGQTTSIDDNCDWFSVETTSNDYEWRIHYRRADGAARRGYHEGW